MTQRSYIAAAALALAFSGSSFANEPTAGKSGSSATSGAPATSAAAQCDSLSGATKEQCMRQLQQGRSDAGSATGATSNRGAGSAGTAAQQPREAAPSGG